ncbi:MAG: hypothetical protein HY226_06290, partial [Candidatus Vogelbacteria bacterium]|nr:hypothetical protein [Candidatus Vogelbacteria bacterium]
MPRPNVAGIDFGSSCTKFVWQRDPDHYGNAGLDRLIFSSTADKTIEEIVVDLQKSNVTMAVATGINIDNETNLNKLLGWRTTIVRPTGDHIDSEISLQAHGAIELLNQVGPSKFRNFLLVSIGTGTSYTFVDWNGSWATKDFGKVERFPLGNAVGGGFIKGVLELAGAGIKTEHIHSTLLDVILDIKIKDLDSSFAGTPMGELPVAYLGNAKHDSNKQDIMQAVTNCVATTIFRDILL